MRGVQVSGLQLSNSIVDRRSKTFWTSSIRKFLFHFSIPAGRTLSSSPSAFRTLITATTCLILGSHGAVAEKAEKMMVGRV